MKEPCMKSEKHRLKWWDTVFPTRRTKVEDIAMTYTWAKVCERSTLNNVGYVYSSLGGSVFISTNILNTHTQVI